MEVFSGTKRADVLLGKVRRWIGRLKQGTADQLRLDSKDPIPVPFRYAQRDGQA